ncbi:hypothetical protein H5410_015073 [Solanum commersonii]|uniref:Uncharacterized protein n=1 Tax=Solanum commersonii TaxID=4109 RepID=A0A9J5ZSR6_SOLCO|nr:hypothetical protein H5410_015073 [Solanum commersonii]
MVSASHTNDDDESCMAKEAQSSNSNEEIDIDALLKRLQEQVEESSSNTTCKGKGKISLPDENSLSSLMLNVKLHGYDYMSETEVVCICYRIYYKLLHTLNPMSKIIDFKNETILIEINFGKSKVVTRRPIRWDEIDFPQEWVIEGAAQPKDNINDKVSEIEQFNDETVKIKFSDSASMHNRIDNHSMSSRISRSNSFYISPVDYIA